MYPKEPDTYSLLLFFLIRIQQQQNYYSLSISLSLNKILNGIVCGIKCSTERAHTYSNGSQPNERAGKREKRKEGKRERERKSKIKTAYKSDSKSVYSRCVYGVEYWIVRCSAQLFCLTYIWYHYICVYVCAWPCHCQIIFHFIFVWCVDIAHIYCVGICFHCEHIELNGNLRYKFNSELAQFDFSLVLVVFFLLWLLPLSFDCRLLALVLTLHLHTQICQFTSWNCMRVHTAQCVHIQR